MTNVKNGVVMNNNDNTTFNLMNDWNLETSMKYQLEVKYLLKPN